VREFGTFLMDVNCYKKGSMPFKLLKIKVLLEEVTEGWLKNRVSEMRGGLCNPTLASAEVLKSKLVSH